MARGPQHSAGLGLSRPSRSGRLGVPGYESGIFRVDGFGVEGCIAVEADRIPLWHLGAYHRGRRKIMVIMSEIFEERA